MFNELNLSEGILKALGLKGFTVPTEIQNKCIPLIVEGKDIVGRSKTGSGKTFAYGLPAIDKIDTALDGVQVVVICPTRELALQVTDEIRKITEFKEGCAVVPVYGGSDMKRQILALKRAKIVVATPGRLMDHIDRRTIKLDKIKLVVLDEADEMLNMGFRDDIEKILKFVPKIRQTVMFSATMPPAIKTITKEYMINPEYIEIGELNSTVELIDQSYVRVSRGGKKRALLEMFKKLSPKQVIVFCNTKRMVDEINDLLNNEGFNSLALHGDMMQSERKKVMTAIKLHKVSTLVATDVAARGIDIDDIDYIFNFDLPNDVEYYIHRIGRTGRAGKSGKAITLINTKEQLIDLNQYKNSTKANIVEDDLSKELADFEEIKAEKKPFGDRSKAPSVSYNQFSKYTGGGFSKRPNTSRSDGFKKSNDSGSKPATGFFGRYEGKTESNQPVASAFQKTNEPATFLRPNTNGERKVNDSYNRNNSSSNFKSRPGSSYQGADKNVSNNRNNETFAKIAPDAKYSDAVPQNAVEGRIKADDLTESETFNKRNQSKPYNKYANNNKESGNRNYRDRYSKPAPFKAETEINKESENSRRRALPDLNKKNEKTGEGFIKKSPPADRATNSFEDKISPKKKKFGNFIKKLVTAKKTASKSDKNSSSDNIEF